MQFFKKHKILICIFLVVFLLLALLSALPFLLTSPWAIRKFFLTLVEEKTFSRIRSEKISCSFSGKKSILTFSKVKIRKEGKKSKEEVWIFQADEIKMTLPLLSLFRIREYRISEMTVKNLSLSAFHPQRDPLRYTVNYLTASKIAANNKGEFFFKTNLPFADCSADEKMLAGEGKGTFALDHKLQIRALGLFLTGYSGRKEHLKMEFLAKKNDAKIYDLQLKASGKKLSIAPLFRLLPAKKFHGTKIRLEDMNIHLRSSHRQESDLFWNFLSGTLIFKLQKSMIPSEILADSKLFRVLDRMFPVLDLLLKNFIDAEKYNLKHTNPATPQVAAQLAETRARLKKYQQKDQLLDKLLKGEAPFILDSGNFSVKIKNGLCNVEECSFTGNMPDEFRMKGSLDLPKERILALNSEMKLADLHIPVYVTESPLENPKVDQKRSLKESWEKNRNTLLSTKLRFLQKKLGKYVTIDGKKLSEMTEQESREKMKKKLKKILKKIKKD